MGRKKKSNVVEVDASIVAPSLVKENFTTEKAIEPVRETQKISGDIVSKLVLDGDVSKMTPSQRVEYYNGLCQALGLNPLTRPFQLIKLNGKEVLYAAKDATDQLRKINGVSVVSSDSKIENDICVCTVKVQDRTGKTDCEIGAVNVKGLAGDALANALMKASTKAKRRATLSICGLGVLDETELETIPALKNVTPHHIGDVNEMIPHVDEPLQVQQQTKPEPTSTIIDPTKCCPWMKSKNYAKPWDTLSDSELTHALEFLEQNYKGANRDAMIKAIEDVLIGREDGRSDEYTVTQAQEKFELDKYDPLTDKFIK